MHRPCGGARMRAAGPASWRTDRSRVLLLVAAMLGSAGELSAAPAGWTHFSRNALRDARAGVGPLSLTQQAWTAPAAADEAWIAHSSPVVADGRVFALARVFAGGLHTADRLIALDAATGARVWTADLEPDALDSWSSPAIDTTNAAVIVATGTTVTAVRISDGQKLWTTSLNQPVVNASPLVMRVADAGGLEHTRVYITDFGLAGASLYAINADAFDASGNPYQPGDLVWTASLPGASGNTPAGDGGHVFVATPDGVVFAFDATDGTPLWQTDVTSGPLGDRGGFFGGLTVRAGFIYAATFNFNGGEDNSALYKLDAADGQLVWSIPAERTDSIPIVADDGTILLSGGIDGFGSQVKIEAFRDDGTSAVKLWDTARDLPAATPLGGWTDQPALVRGQLFVGVPDPADFFGPYTALYVLDTRRTPADAGFLRASASGAGGSPALDADRLYSLGTAGLVAFETTLGCRADINADGVVDVADLSQMLAAFGAACGDPVYDADSDLNGDGVIDVADLSVMLAATGATCP